MIEQTGVQDSDPDTIELDHRGNIVRITGPDNRERRAYDDNDVLVRRWINSDFTAQYIARYSVHGDTLVQSWRELNSRDWNLQGDTSTRGHRVNVFVFDHDGKVRQEFDDGLGQIIYRYSDGKLLFKELEIRHDTENEFQLIKTGEYSYAQNGEIKRIKVKSLDDRDKVYIFYFSRGLLDSSQILFDEHYASRPMKYMYKYAYY